MDLTEQEKEELFDDFRLRMAELDKEEKRLGAAKNIHALKGMSRYYRDTFDHTNCNSRATKEQWDFYNCHRVYSKLRAVIPSMVMAKKYKGKNVYQLRLSGLRFEEAVLEDEDMEEATKAGKILIDAVIKYLTEE